MPEVPADPSGGVEGGGGVEAVRGCPSPPGPTTLSPRSRLYPAETDVEALFQVGPQPPDLSCRLVLPVEHLVLLIEHLFHLLP